VLRGQRSEFSRPFILVFYTVAATFHSSSSLVVLTRLSGPRSRPPICQKIWWGREWNPGPLDLWPETLTTRPQRRSNVWYCKRISLSDNQSAICCLSFICSEIFFDRTLKNNALCTRTAIREFGDRFRILYFVYYS
jgi:hypothetical protein